MKTRQAKFLMRNVVIAGVVAVLASCGYQLITKTANSETSKEAYQRMGPPPDFAAINNISERKAEFFDYMRDGIHNENQRILHERQQLKQIKQSLDKGGDLSDKEKVNAKLLGELYDLKINGGTLSKKWVNHMLRRVDVIPEALALAQAANESAWGTSRFARNANNFFGQWCYQAGCGLVPKQRGADMTHEVAKFSSVSQSVHRYFMNVNRNKAYQPLRHIRYERRQRGEKILSTSAALKLVQGLTNYSERGQEYVNIISSMIKHNEQYWEY
ncbi:MAG: glucosaminidase domain-containing protein [Vibrio sp.]